MSKRQNWMRRRVDRSGELLELCKKGKVLYFASKWFILSSSISFSDRQWGDRAARKKTKQRQSLTSPSGPKSPRWASIASSADLVIDQSTDLGPSETPPSSSSSFQRSESVSSELEQTACRRQQALTLHHILWDIFVEIQESRSAIWLGSNCCPYIEVTAVCCLFRDRLVVWHEPMLMTLENRSPRLLFQI